MQHFYTDTQLSFVNIWDYHTKMQHKYVHIDIINYSYYDLQINDLYNQLLFVDMQIFYADMHFIVY